MRKGVVTHCVQYPICQCFKAQPVKPAGLLQPLAIPERPWEDISIDLLTDLPPTQRKHTTICTVVCRFSKMAHFIAMTNATDA